MNSDSPISSIYLKGVNDTWIYYPTGYSDSQCTTEVWNTPMNGQQCVGPPDGVNVWSLYIY